jgi:hypothetical protein
MQGWRHICAVCSLNAYLQGYKRGYLRRGDTSSIESKQITVTVVTVPQRQTTSDLIMLEINIVSH